MHIYICTYIIYICTLYWCIFAVPIRRIYKRRRQWCDDSTHTYYTYISHLLTTGVEPVNSCDNVAGQDALQNTYSYTCICMYTHVTYSCYICLLNTCTTYYIWQNVASQDVLPEMKCTYISLRMYMILRADSICALLLRRR